MNFTALQQIIRHIDDGFQMEAGRSVNRHLTLRNWLIGHYIVEFEQRGDDRAAYGERLLENLAAGLDRPGLSRRNLNVFRMFYLVYPKVGSVAFRFLAENPVGQVLLPLQVDENQNVEIWQTSAKSYEVEPEMLISRLSFSQLTLIMQFDDPLKRAFYEIESIRGGWAVRELKRQIDSALYERTGLSQDKIGLLERVHKNATALLAEDFIRTPYVFEFLGLPADKIVEESALEQALINHLQQFLLELGRGFCFEARQKRILIGTEWHKVDLVFYHRLLKCHVLIDLKNGPFKLDHAGQMNGYINYFLENERQPDDNHPIGILLCNGKDETVVKYALGGLDERIFVSRYRLYLPDEATLQAFLENELKQV